MRRKGRWAVIAVALGSAVGAAGLRADVVVDDFTQGAGFVGAGGPGYFYHTDDGLDSDHTIGGTRYFAVQACLHPAVGTLPIEHDPAAGVIEVGGTAISQWCEGVIFEYGWSYSDEEPREQLDLDLIEAGVTHLEIDLLSLNRETGRFGPTDYYYQGSLSLGSAYTHTYSDGSTTERVEYRGLDFFLPDSAGPTTVQVPLDALMLTAEGNYDPANIDAIGLYTGGADAGSHLVIDAIRLVGLGAGPPDYNSDGFISQADLDLVLLNWGQAERPSGWTSGEAFDGQVSQNELDAVLLNWGDGVAPSFTAIPEPGGLVLLGVTGVVGLTRGRRR